MGGRMDTIQCAIVNVKLKYYEKDLALRQEVAEKYNKVFSSSLLVSSKDQEPETRNQKLITPTISDSCTSAWAQYSVRIKSSPYTNNQQPTTRDLLQEKLKDLGIPTAVHYPMPLHLQECFAYLGYEKGDFPICEQVSNEIMSLPMNPYVSDEEIAYISTKL
jgi:UDP-2-acetamido-2-deoxy-ribo-hexuluronate aminotransferase